MAGGALSFPVLDSLVALPLQVLFKTPTLGPAVEQYQRTVASLGRLQELHDLPVEQAHTGHRLDPADVKGELVLDDITFAYPGRPPVLNKLTLHIAPGAVTGIVGVTGAGKTTLAKLLLRFHDTHTGHVLIDGHNIRDVCLHDLRHAIGFVAQDTFLFDGTITDNIRYGSFDATPTQVTRAARLAEADGFITTLPARYDTMVGERGTALSGGQRQRIALARTILKDPPVVILDEATSAVDNETEAAIQHALAEFARDRTLIIIAHRLSTIRHADHIYVMNNTGMITEHGTHPQLLQHDGTYAALWRLQIGQTNQ